MESRKADRASSATNSTSARCAPDRGISTLVAVAPMGDAANREDIASRVRSNRYARNVKLATNAEAPKIPVCEPYRSAKRVANVDPVDDAENNTSIVHKISRSVHDAEPDSRWNSELSSIVDYVGSYTRRVDIRRERVERVARIGARASIDVKIVGVHKLSPGEKRTPNIYSIHTLAASDTTPARKRMNSPNSRRRSDTPTRRKAAYNYRDPRAAKHRGSVAPSEHTNGHGRRHTAIENYTESRSNKSIRSDPVELRASCKNSS